MVIEKRRQHKDKIHLICTERQLKAISQRLCPIYVFIPYLINVYLGYFSTTYAQPATLYNYILATAWHTCLDLC